MGNSHALLVVDDEAVVCQACQRIFSRQGFSVEMNTDARQGLAWATRDYEIILLDIKMPVVDGIQFLEQLREKKHEVPVLIITGYPSIPNAAAAMRLGACDYVTKPFTSEEITSAVQRVLATRRAAEEERRPAAEGGESAGSAAVAEAVLGGIVVPRGARRIRVCGGRPSGLAGSRRRRRFVCRGSAKWSIRGCLLRASLAQ